MPKTGFLKEAVDFSLLPASLNSFSLSKFNENLIFSLVIFKSKILLLIYDKSKKYSQILW
jgi:hypothetical protein